MMHMDRMMMVFALCLIGLASAFSVRPDIQGVQDTGSTQLPAMDVGITIDCSSNMLTVTVDANDTGQPVQGANTYLFYTNYGYQAIGSGESDNMGIAAIPVTGKLDFLTSLFVLRVDKEGYRSRETEFTYNNCFNGQPTGSVPQNSSPAQTVNQSSNQPVNQTAQTNVTVPAPSNQTAPTNLTAASSGNSTANTPTPKPSSKLPCLPGFLLIALIAYALKVIE